MNMKTLTKKKNQFLTPNGKASHNIGQLFQNNSKEIFAGKFFHALSSSAVCFSKSTLLKKKIPTGQL